MDIESVQNATVKALVRLKTKKERDQTGLFLVEGAHLIEEAKAAGILQKVYQSVDLPPVEGVPTITCSQAVLNKISSLQSDASQIGLCKKEEKPLPENGRRFLILERVQDPGNVGTLIRSAYSFGMDGVICSPDCADPYSPKTIQSAKGALFHIPLITADLPGRIESLKSRNIPVYGAALHQNSIELHDLHISDRAAVVIGNEGHGLSQTVLDACSQLVHIEMKNFESLNAAVAGSILMYIFQF